MFLEYVIKKDDGFKTINDVLTSYFGISSRLRNKLINLKAVKLNGVFVNTKNFVKESDSITIDFDYDEDNSNIVPTKMDLDIIYEDEWLIIINKPAGIAIHPSLLHYTDSLSNGVRYYFDSIGLKKKVRPVNRLDSNTSGLVVFAKCEYIQECFIKQMANKTFKKEYLCITEGVFDKKAGIIDLPIARKPGSIIERCVDKNGQNAITHYEVIKEFENCSLVKCLLETGRTHQIRVHMSYIGHPLLGDTLYGKPSKLINRQALHSYMIEFIHPVYKKVMNFTCNLPEDMKQGF